ncbi:8-amino-7-oxononanoate synthase [Cupriavidus sp. EM10]|uniref:8-amino-7-oxononanoate synthase n=1 Tax=Cupriavidus sp. EM10 TaxID=2839983 RepID=UPI001C001A95|nr:8-amino-7-oxononanoate synthase [Cupriavidus sp. EM10]QWE98164.1 8-amino-7-oxononanoate synthase [Cupriavidus sp. EM10]
MLLEQLGRAAAERAANALTRCRSVAHTACEPHQAISRDGQGTSNSLLSFCSNDYLGLANHPAVVEAFVEGARRYGAGSGASHLVCGHSLAHHQLEAKLAMWQAPYIPDVRALYFCTGYMANLAVLSALGTSDATLFCDKLNHASLIDGALLARAEVRRYPHRDTGALNRQLSASNSPLKLIVTDGVFSMDGDIAPLAELLVLAELHDAWIVVDDAHGFGVLGEQGRGLLAHLGLKSKRFIYVGTLGKAAGVAGAFVAAHTAIVEHLVNVARPYIYTTAAPPAVAHALLTSLTLIGGDEGRQRRRQVAELIALLRGGLEILQARHPKAGWRMINSATPIQPLVVGDNAAALTLSQALAADGIRVTAIRPPTVPDGTARLRITFSAEHTRADVARLLNSLQILAANRESA